MKDPSQTACWKCEKYGNIQHDILKLLSAELNVQIGTLKYGGRFLTV
jgi:hypothetical protein